MKPVSKITALFAAASLLLSTSGCASSADGADDHGHEELHITNGWVRVAEFDDGEMGMTGAFAEIENHTAADVSLVGGTAEVAGKVEVHEVVMADGAMKMQQKDGGIAIPAGQAVTLEPGGLHLMLLALKNQLLEGDTVTITLDFEGAEDLTFTWPVRASLAGDESYDPEANH